MADSDSAPWLARPAAQAVADCTDGSTVTVHSGAWSDLVPNLPSEFARMLAPPIVVSSNPVDGPVTDTDRRAELDRYRRNMAADPQDGRHRRTGRNR